MVFIRLTSSNSGRISAATSSGEFQSAFPPGPGLAEGRRAGLEVAVLERFRGLTPRVLRLGLPNPPFG